MRARFKRWLNTKNAYSQMQKNLVQQIQKTRMMENSLTEGWKGLPKSWYVKILKLKKMN